MYSTHEYKYMANTHANLERRVRFGCNAKHTKTCKDQYRAECNFN